MKALEPWVVAPLESFLAESAARLALLMTSSGQVVAQHGFSRSLDVMTAAALGAGIVASTDELARLMGAGRFEALVHNGQRQSCMLASFSAGAELLQLHPEGGCCRGPTASCSSATARPWRFDPQSREPAEPAGQSAGAGRGRPAAPGRIPVQQAGFAGLKLLPLPRGQMMPSTSARCRASADALHGGGVFETLRGISELVLKRLAVGSPVA